MQIDNESPDTVLQRDLSLIGLYFRGSGTLGETWVDLQTRSHVFYGLNGAGKTTVLQAISDGLTGRGRNIVVVAQIPHPDESMSVGVSRHSSEMLTGTIAGDLEEEFPNFVTTEGPAMLAAFESRLTANPLTGLEEHDWDDFFTELASSRVWAFRPATGFAGTWEASPALLIDPLASPFAEHLRELHKIIFEEGYGPSEFGLDLAWEGLPQPGAPQFVFSTFIRKRVEQDPSYRWWPFGDVIVPDPDHAQKLSEKTRDHLRETYEDEVPRRDLHRGPRLESRREELEQHANVVLADLLADSPVLTLNLGDEARWFFGRSCEWAASRFDGDEPVAISDLSSAEQFWVAISIELALRLDLERRQELPGILSRTWLILDEPERGLHRTAETHMARGLHRLGQRGARIICATHSPDLLDGAIADVSYVRRRSSQHSGTVISMSDFDHIRDSLGLNPSDLLRRTRAFILVEGEHDLAVLEGAFSDELHRLGVTVLATRGGSRLKTVVDSKFLYQFTDAILFPLLDDLHMNPLPDIWEDAKNAARVEAASEVISRLEAELRNLPGKGQDFLTEFLSASIKHGRFDRVEPLGIPQSDVLLCLPVTALVPEHPGTWIDLRAEAARQYGRKLSETDFKKFLTRRYKADLSAENIRAIAGRSAPHPDLKAIVAAVSSRLDR